ncbi:hypothetical protein HDU85_002105 [Gaertneriomyces sp. JEL0708]|nr:hypothetical protein HDU85_002105 [Gaertneriomyces sp. JEL0708]
MTREVTIGDVESGKVDIQGIDWAKLHVPRTHFRDARIRSYSSYKNVSVPQDRILEELVRPPYQSRFYTFRHTLLTTKPHIVHFQLRNLLWATSKHDIFFTSQNGVIQYNPITKTSSLALDLRKHQMATMKISTMAAEHGWICVGGFSGEYICRRLSSSPMPGSSSDGREVHQGSITSEENGITNHITISTLRSATTPTAIISSNDNKTRFLSLRTMSVTQSFSFPYAINCTSLSPDKRLLCVVGDSPTTSIISSDTGEQLVSLSGHLDFSFACGFSPDGRLLATGNQDMTVRLYDTRFLASDKTLAVLGSRMGAVRSLRFDETGRFLVWAEPADFVHVTNLSGVADAELVSGGEGQDHSWISRVSNDGHRKDDTLYSSQLFDFFGEISGVSFTPDAEGLYVGIADPKYGSILEFERSHSHGTRNKWYDLLRDEDIWL